LDAHNCGLNGILKLPLKMWKIFERRVGVRVLDDEFWVLNSKTDFEIKWLLKSEKQTIKRKGEFC
jgi:hypothetical protein